MVFKYNQSKTQLLPQPSESWVGKHFLATLHHTREALGKRRQPGLSAAVMPGPPDSPGRGLSRDDQELPLVSPADDSELLTWFGISELLQSNLSSREEDHPAGLSPVEWTASGHC